MEAKNQQLTSNIIMLESRNDQLGDTVDKLQVKVSKGDARDLQDEVAKLKAKLDLKEQKLAAKDAECRQLLENSVRSESELKKQLALVEQKADLQSRKLGETTGREDDAREKLKTKAQEMTEFAAVIKQLRAENKSLRANTPKVHESQDAELLQGQVRELQQIIIAE